MKKSLKQTLFMVGGGIAGITVAGFIEFLAILLFGRQGIPDPLLGLLTLVLAVTGTVMGYRKGTTNYERAFRKREKE